MKRDLKSTRHEFVSTNSGAALALDPGGSGVIAALRRGVQPAPGAFSVFDAPAPLHHDPEAVEDGVAILCLSGPLEHHESGIWQSYEALTAEVQRALADPDVRALILKIDSSGGRAAGMAECHKAIRRARKASGKPLYAYVDELAASSAYNVAAACDEIWLPPDGQVGSVGVIAGTVDDTAQLEAEGIKVRWVVTGARKADGRPGQPVDDEVLAAVQKSVDHSGQLFFRAVAKARGMTPEAVEGLQAAVFHGKDGVKAGLADGVCGWPAFLKMVRSSLGISTPDVSGDSKSSGSVRVKAGTSSPRSEAMMAAQKKLLSLTKARDEAQAAVASAKTVDERKKLLATFEAAAVALATFQADGSVRRDQASATSTKAKMAEEEEEESEEEEEEEDSDSDDEEEEESYDSDDEDDDDKDEKSSSGVDTEAEKAEAKAFLKATTGLYTPARLLRLCRQVTGQKGVNEVFGALDGMGQRVKAADKSEARLARLEGESRKAKVEKMLATAKREGKITRAQFPTLAAKGMSDPKFLKGFLAQLPQIVRTTEDGPSLPRMDAEGNPVGLPTNSEQEKIMAMALGGLRGEEREKAVAAVAERHSKKLGNTRKF